MGQKPYPVQCSFELTPCCNFRCKMCYVRLAPEELSSKGRQLTAAEWIRLGEQAVDAGTLCLTITGGEPLVRPDFAEIYTAFTEMGFWITLQTNLSLLDDKLMALLEERPPKLIKATLYGASNETYEKVCGVKNGLTRVEAGIQAVQKAKIPLRLVATVIRENEGDLNAIHQLAAEHGLPLQHTYGVMDSKRNANHRQILASRIQYEDLTAAQKAAVKEKPHPPIATPLELCGNYVHGGYWVLWNGHMSLCAHMEMGFVPLDSSIEACFSEMLQALETSYPKGVCSQCGNNSSCRACPAAVYVEGIAPGSQKCTMAHTRKLCSL